MALGCDGCFDWFHFSCLGVTKKELRKEKWLCPKCVKRKSPVKKVPIAYVNEPHAKILKRALESNILLERSIRGFIESEDIVSLGELLDQNKNFSEFALV